MKSSNVVPTLLLSPVSISSSAGTSLLSGHAPGRAAGPGLPQEPRSLRDLAKAITDAPGREHEHAGHGLDQNKLSDIVRCTGALTTDVPERKDWVQAEPPLGQRDDGRQRGNQEQLAP
jgi:hypothetical protein